MTEDRKEAFPALDLILAISLLLAIPLAAFSPWRPIFIEGFVQNKSTVGLITAVFSLLLIPFYLLISRLVLKFGKVIMLLGSVFLMLAASLLSLVPFFGVFIFAHTIYLLSRAFIFYILELLVKKYAPEGKIHSIQGRMSSVVNLGWFLGPIIGGVLIGQNGFLGILWFLVLIAGINVFLVLRGMALFDPRPSSPPVNIGSLAKDFKEFVGRTDYQYYYFIAVGLNAVYAVTTTFLPLLLLELKASNKLLSVGFALMVLPFVILEPLVGRLADKIGQERRLFALGFLIMSLSLIFTGLTSQPLVLIGLLILGSVGASLIEGVDQSLFMKRANHHKTFMIGFFSTAGQLGFVLALFLSSLILVFLDLPSLFILFGFLLLVFSWTSLRLSKTVDG